MRWVNHVGGSCVAIAANNVMIRKAMSGADQTARPSTASGHKVEHDWSIAQFPCDWDPVSIKSQKYEPLVPGGQGLGDTWMRVDYDSARHLKSICLISCQSTFVLKNLFLWMKSGRCLDGCVKWERECWLKEEIDGRWNSNRVLIFWIKTSIFLFSSSSWIDCTPFQVGQLNF